MRMLACLATVGAVWLAAPRSVAAHGVAPDATSPGAVALAWSIEAHIVLPLLAAALLYRWAVASVNRAHPRNGVPRWRVRSWYAGLAVLFIALASPIGTYDTTLFSVHMVQHLLLTMVAPPLLALGAPITLLLRVAAPATRRRIILPLLHSRVTRIISFPVLTWVMFAGVMWGTHFSPLFDAALDNEMVHLFEHALYLGTAMLFWWPVVGADPSPWRLPHPARLAYLFLGMPYSSFLAVAILSAPGIMYPHYESVARTWGPSALADQQLAGGIMWIFGDGLFLVALILAIWVWMRAEEAEGRRVDARLDRETAGAARAMPAMDAPYTSRD